ncbi:hypothetical protein LINPERPRIM_LOCUS4320 [Linum perenne]
MKNLIMLRAKLEKAKIEARKLQKEAKEQCKKLQKLQKVRILFVEIKKSMTKFGCGGVAAAEKYGTGVSEYGGGMERNGGETAAVSGNGDDILGKMVAF